MNAFPLSSSCPGFARSTAGPVDVAELSKSECRLRRLLDLVAAPLLLLLAAPVMAITALVLLILEGRPIFYSQVRVGLGGTPFRILKFRSMRRDAEADGRARWASADDSRVTRTGRFIRRTRIDELPQLLNVLKGDMTLIGPRPERPEFVATLSGHSPEYSQRHTVKPGLTGWAQVRCAYAGSVQESEWKLRYDLQYIRHRSFLLDLRILLETVRVVVTGEGAR